MSEISSGMPPELQQFKTVEQVPYSNGVNHVYGIRPNDKMTHISFDSVLSAYGYGTEGQPEPQEQSIKQKQNKLVNNGDNTTMSESFSPAPAPIEARTPSGSLGQMEALATQTLLNNAEQARTEAQTLADMASVEARRNSAEVSALNDRAELEIFGSKNATFTNPETGEVIASPEKPIKGKLAEIVENPKYGKTQAERQERADNYAKEVQTLVDGGLELSQAKLVQDLREADVTASAKVAGNQLGNGTQPEEALASTDLLYEKKDAARLKLIKEQHLYTAEEYAQARGKKTETTPTPEATPANPFAAAPTGEAASTEAPTAATAVEAGNTPRTAAELAAEARALAEMPDDVTPVTVDRNTTPFAAPNNGEAVVSSYIGAEKIPLVGIDELQNELMTKIEAGDDSNWDSLVNAILDANKVLDQQDGFDAEQRMQETKQELEEMHAELLANKANAAVDQTDATDVQNNGELDATPEQRRTKTARLLGKFGLGKSGAKVESVAEDSDDHSETTINKGSKAYRLGNAWGNRKAAKQASKGVKVEDATDASEDAKDHSDDGINRDSRAYKWGYKRGQKKAAKQASPQSRPVDPILAEQYDAAQVAAATTAETLKDVYADVATNADKVTQEAISRPEGFVGLTWTENGVTRKVTGKTPEGLVITDTYDDGQDRSNKIYSTDELLAILKSDEAADGFTWSE